MKTKKMENILKFVDKNMKFKSEFRGKRRTTSKQSSTSKTIKNNNKPSSSRTNIRRWNKKKKNGKYRTSGR